MRVSVANDPNAGTLTFSVTTDMPTMEPNSEIDILVDSDLNSSTGQGGFDYLFGLDSNGWFFADDGAITDPYVTYNNGVLSFQTVATDLGSPSSFNFFVASFRGSDPNNLIDDQAPDQGVWTYTLTTAPPPAPAPAPSPAPKPVVAQVSTVAAVYKGTPTAGKPFVISGLAVSLSTGAKTRAAALHCTAKLGGKVFKGGSRSGCVFHLPKTAKGLRLVVKVTGKYRTVAVSRSYSFKVR
jgi:hypothetical protein